MNINGNLKFLGQGQALNFRVENLDADPVAPFVGQVWYNTTENTYKGFDGTGVTPFASGGSTGAIAAELDATQAGAGLNSDGTYNAPTGSNYLDATTSLANADLALDTQVKTNTDAIAAEVTARTAADTAAAGALTTAIANEVTARNAAILVETTARTAADTAEATARAAADTSEAAARAAADTTELNARISADTVAAATAADQLATETTARLAGDATINGRIDDVQAELDATQAGAGLAVDGAYHAPSNTTYLGSVTSLKAADVALDLAISDEATARASADTAFTAALAAEAQTRTDADTAIQTQLDALSAGQMTGGTEITTESTARAAADAAIQAELDLTQASVGLPTDGSFAAITGSNFIDAATTVLSAITILDGQAQIAADALAAETTARTAADTAFTNSLNTEITARTAADTAQQTELNAVEAGAGLETNGTYASPTGSNYLNSATSLKDADYKLDAQVKVVADAVAAAATANSTNAAAITSEVTARIAADAAEATARDAAIAVETTARIAADAAEATARDAAISDEADARTAADAAEATARGDAIATVTALVNGGYFLYTGASAATTHVVTHGIGSKYANVTVVDSSDQVVIPNSITFDSTTQLTVTFSSAITCKVVVAALKV